MNMRQDLKMYFPGKLVFGNGSLEALAGEVLLQGYRKILLLTIEPLLPALQCFLGALKSAHLAVSVDTSIIREPTFDDFESLLNKAIPFDPDVVIGIGGGSVLDVAKLVAAQLQNPQTLQEIVGTGLLKGRKKALICIPSTAGTGSEASPNAILVDGSDHQKKGIISPFLVPDIVYVDPLLTLSVPSGITAATGIDALTHCIEAYTNKFAQPLVDMYALEGMRLIALNLVRAVTQGDDAEARSGVAMGSLLGGFCLGPVNTAGVHALAYPLGSLFHLGHGLSNALLLPHVMAFNVPAAPCRYAAVAAALGCERESDDMATAWKGIQKVRSLNAACGVPPGLGHVGVPEEAICRMAADAMKITRLLKNNPRTITEEDAAAIYRAAY